MREIKFRVWDKVHEEMINWEQYKDELVSSDFTDEGLILMQYTGLKDRDGVEIYEGDILALKGHWGIRVEYEKGTMWVRDKDEIRYTNRILDVPISSITINMWEVIGNVFENPELLKED